MEYPRKNIFKNARELEEFTQEKSAELLGVSVSTIGNWERYEFKEFDLNNLVKMAELYKRPALIWEYLLLFSPVSEHLPDIKLMNLAEAGMTLGCVMDEFQELSKRLFKILCDGKISDIEKKDWNELFVPLLWSIASKSLSLYLSATTKQGKE